MLEWRYTLLLALVVVVAAVVGSWRSANDPPPQDVSSYYAQGLDAYQAGDFAKAVEVLGRAYAVNGGDVGVNTLLGWSHWRLTNVQQARFHFERALERDGSSVDAQTGLGFASLAQGDLDTALPLLEGVAKASPRDRDVTISLANAYVRSGANRKAAGVYREMLGHDPGDPVARREFLGMYGLPDYDDAFSLDLPPYSRPDGVQQAFRARGDYLQVRDGAGWKDVYLVGANLGPARPGEFPSTVSREYAVHAQWLREMATMRANTVRVYTILPPAFYRALADHNRQAASPLWLIQEVWINDDAQDLYEARTENEFKDDLKRVIDLLHGRGDVPYRPGAQFGIYSADVSAWVVGLAVGREIEPHLAQRTNARHARETSYGGRHVRLDYGNPTEAWFARMCDLAVTYERERYNAQRPLTVVNWPPLDTLAHPTESTIAEEVALRQARGEPVSMNTFALADFTNDTDVVSLDITKFRTGPEFTSGLFSLYHVYQHWPDFLFREPSFARVRDAQGPNRYLGYLQALKKAHPGMPLLIGEYGAATSIGVAHLHPEGWHNGGFDEAAQAALLTRFTTNHAEARAAGSIVFAWKDEWWKKVADQFTGDFEVPRDRDPLWLNVLDPEEMFGIVGYEPAFPVPLLRGTADDWSGAQSIASSARPGTPIRNVFAMADYAYLYLRVDVEPGTIDWAQRHLWLALNTLPGESGSRTLPDLPLRIETGTNFLVQFTGPQAARLLIAENYSPNQPVPVPGVSGETRIARKTGQAIFLAEAAPFGEILTEANQRRFGRDGTFFPAETFSRSPLAHGTADRSVPAFSDHALWHADPGRGIIEVRLPWAAILMTDPSNRHAFGGTDAEGVPASRPTPGVSIAALLVTAAGGGERRVLASLPALQGAALETAPPVFGWKTWETVDSRPYFKRAYSALTPLFEKLGRGPQ